MILETWLAKILKRAMMPRGISTVLRVKCCTLFWRHLVQINVSQRKILETRILNHLLMIFSCRFKETALLHLLHLLDDLIGWAKLFPWNSSHSWFCWKVQNCCLLTDSQRQLLNSKSYIRSPTNGKCTFCTQLFCTKYKWQYPRNATFVHKNTEYFFQKNTFWKHTLELKSFVNHIC